jgi:ribokinase
MKKILVIGSTNTDMVVKTDHLPAPGETILGGEFLMNPGGKGANQAVAAARLGGRVCFVSKTGSDIFGKQAIQNFENEGIDTTYLLTDSKKPSGVAMIAVDKNAENCIVVAPGANMNLTESDIGVALSKIKESEIVLLQLEIPISTVEYAARIASEKKARVILNPAPATKLSAGLLKCITIITPNETEAGLLTGIKVTDENSAKKAALVLREKGVEIIIITRGSEGSFIYSDSVCKQVPAPKVKAIDTTAAGDTFNGALCVAIANGFDIEKAVVFANKAASVAVTRLGAQSSAPYKNEVII